MDYCCSAGGLVDTSLLNWVALDPGDSFGCGWFVLVVEREYQAAGLLLPEDCSLSLVYTHVPNSFGLL